MDDLSRRSLLRAGGVAAVGLGTLGTAAQAAAHPWRWSSAGSVPGAGTGADPRFVYANRTAQRCFGYSWEEFIGLPSRLSAEAPERSARQALLDAVARDGFASGYRGVRVTKSGHRFWIEDGVVWRLVGRDGAPAGQAATFSAWRDA